MKLPIVIISALTIALIFSLSLNYKKEMIIDAYAKEKEAACDITNLSLKCFSIMLYNLNNK